MEYSKRKDDSIPQCRKCHVLFTYIWGKLTWYTRLISLFWCWFSSVHIHFAMNLMYTRYDTSSIHLAEVQCREKERWWRAKKRSLDIFDCIPVFMFAYTIPHDFIAMRMRHKKNLFVWLNVSYTHSTCDWYEAKANFRFSFFCFFFFFHLFCLTSQQLNRLGVFVLLQKIWRFPMPFVLIIE